MRVQREGSFLKLQLPFNSLLCPLQALIHMFLDDCPGIIRGQCQFKMIQSAELLDALFQSPLTKIVAVLCNELLAVLHDESVNSRNQGL